MSSLSRSTNVKSSATSAGAPIDLDEQCGVITDKNVACSRSLTCKTHGVGAKRAVPGRTKAFDTLLIEFQKRKERRLKQKAERERQQQEQLGNKDGGGNIAIPAMQSKINLDADGDDIAVPQAGSSAQHSIRLLSPSPMNSITGATSSNMDDIQVQQSYQEPHQTTPQTTQQPPKPSQLAPSHQHAEAAATASSSVPVVKTKANISLLSGSVNASPSKSVAGGNATSSAPASTKKKKTGEGGKTSKSKASARNKADLILGEVDDPPESTNAGAASSTLIGADGNLIVEEEAPDSDDEVDQLLMAMNQSRARPLALPPFPAYERTPMKLAKYRESFLTAFTGRSMSSSAS